MRCKSGNRQSFPGIKLAGHQVVSNRFLNLLLQLFPKPWTVDTFVEVFLGLIQKTLDYEMKMQICAVSHFAICLASIKSSFKGKIFEPTI